MKALRRPFAPGPGRRRIGALAQRRMAGFTLIELLVAVTIGMALVLAISLMLVRHESGRRSLTSINDTSMGGAYLGLVLDRTVRSAGSGFTQAWRTGFGCRLLVSRSGDQVLPRTTAFPAPFTSVPGAQRLMPVIAYPGAGAGGSDVIGIATGSSALGETPMRVAPGSITATALRVTATVGLRPRDLAFVMDDAVDCMLQQVADDFAGYATEPDVLRFGGTYADSEIAGVALAGMGASVPAWIAPVGSRNGNLPAFQLIGVGADNTLVSYDLLNLDGTDAVVPLADGVVDLRLLYGIDNDDNGTVDSWRNPATDADYKTAQLMDGTAEAQRKLARILSVRIGLLLRNSVPERAAVSPASLTLFADLDSTLHRTRTLTTDEQRLRWRTLEVTVPLRNVMLK